MDANLILCKMCGNFHGISSFCQNGAAGSGTITILSEEKKALKNDNEKPDLSLIPYIAQVEEAKAFRVGEIKYGRYNYTNGMEVTRLIAAILRHVQAYNNGEDYDPVDGQHHLGSARAGCAMILRQTELGTLIDNRYKKEKK